MRNSEIAEEFDYRKESVDQDMNFLITGCLFEREKFEQNAKILNFHHISTKYGSFGKKHSHFCDFKQKLPFLLPGGARKTEHFLI